MEELDRRAAKLMGAKEYVWFMDLSSENNKRIYEWFTFKELREMHECNMKHDAKLFSPTTNPAHARMLLDEIRNHGNEMIDRFINILFDIITPPYVIVGSDIDMMQLHWLYITATPAQITAAFCKAMGGGE